MKTLNVNWKKAILFCFVMSLFLACDKSSEPMGKGEVEFQITDAPSDDASVKGVFVTIADLKVDGKSISGFTKQTIDLKAYQEGKTKLLGTSQLSAKSYSNLTLILDADKDANGNAPGCYVLTTDDAKYKLRSSGNVEVVLNKGWSVIANSKSTIIMDFDLRKSIQTMADPSIRYNFVSNDNLKAAIRLMSKDKVGTINGSYSEQANSNADKIIVYAYKKGTFNASTETQSQGDGGIFFKNSDASAEVKQGLTNKTFTLAFLEEGDYELHFAAYKKDLATNRFVFQTMLKSETSANGSAGNFITVQSGITITLSSTITGTI